MTIKWKIMSPCILSCSSSIHRRGCNYSLHSTAMYVCGWSLSRISVAGIREQIVSPVWRWERECDFSTVIGCQERRRINNFRVLLLSWTALTRPLTLNCVTLHYYRVSGAVCGQCETGNGFVYPGWQEECEKGRSGHARLRTNFRLRFPKEVAFNSGKRGNFYKD